jgi:hypothetical protein
MEQNNSLDIVWVLFSRVIYVLPHLAPETMAGILEKILK